MTEFEVFSGAHALASEALDSCTDADRRRYLQDLRKELWSALGRVQRQDAAPLVFDLTMPGYVTLGRAGEERVLPHPGLPGLDDAWRILLAGLTAKDTLRAADIIGGKRPGNALRNRLAHAAEWIERTGMCPALAQVLRRPSISITEDGLIIPGPRPLVTLQAECWNSVETYPSCMRWLTMEQD